MAKVVIAGFVEIIWVTGLDNAHSLLSWVVTLFFALSFYLVIDASKHLPVGTVYAFS